MSEKRYRTQTLEFGMEFDAEAARLKLAVARQQLAEATAEARHAARGMAEHHRTEDEISTRLGVTRRTVRRWLNRSAPAR